MQIATLFRTAGFLLLCAGLMPSLASAAQYWKYSTDNTYPITATLDLGGMAVNATKVVSTDNSNVIQPRILSWTRLCVQRSYT